MSQTMQKKRIKFFQRYKKSPQVSQHISIEQSASNENSQNYFQSFIYNDHITNNKLYLQNGIFDKENVHNNANNSYMLLKSTKRFHLKSLKDKNYRVKDNKDHSLESCIKSISSFQRDRIKNYLVKRKISKQNYSEQKKQLSMLLSRDRTYLYSSAGASLQKTPRNSFKPKPTSRQQDIEFFQNFQEYNEKENIQDVCKQKGLLCHQQTDQALKELSKKFSSSAELLQKFEQFLKQEKINEIRKQKKGISKLVPETLDYKNLTKSERQLVNKLDIQLRRQVIKNSEYLIVPDLSKVKRLQKMRTTPGKGVRMMQNIISNPISNDKQEKDRKNTEISQKTCLKKTSCREQSSKKIASLKSQIQPSQTKQPKQQKQKQIKNYRFKNDQLLHLVKNFDKKASIQNTLTRRNSPSQNTLISQLKKGSYFKLQIQLSSNPQLLSIKQQKTKNNLLHLCVINNRPQIFKMILIKCRENNVNLLSQPNKYGKTPFQIAKIYKYFYEECKNLDQFVYCYRWV